MENSICFIWAACAGEENYMISGCFSLPYDDNGMAMKKFFGCDI